MLAMLPQPPTPLSGGSVPLRKHRPSLDPWNYRATETTTERLSRLLINRGPRKESNLSAAPQQASGLCHLLVSPEETERQGWDKGRASQAKLKEALTPRGPLCTCMTLGAHLSHPSPGSVGHTSSAEIITSKKL